MKNLILGTAGHIDHGKTTLVKALTGIDTDRLPEEKARGITIELGFARLEIPGEVLFSIVDVPGHERFIRTMVAGTGGMDMVMLVIAADEGVMPQTREHLEICKLLGIQKGVVALTKCDLVTPDWLELVTEEVREFLTGSFLEESAILPVSARKEIGLENLLHELRTLTTETVPKRADAPFRLPVDRVMTVPGFGTVVTGTVLSGTVSPHDEVDILPEGVTGRIRGIQVHGVSCGAGSAGERTALNLQGIDHCQVQRGDVVTLSGVFRTTGVVDVHLHHLPSAPTPLKHRAMLRFHSGTSELCATVVLFGHDSLAPGESGFAQLRLSRPTLLVSGDPFVLRSSSPSRTVGGGTVLDPFPPQRRRRSSEALQLLASLAAGHETEIVAGIIGSSLLSGVAYQELARRSGFSAKRLEAALSPLLASGSVLQVARDPGIYIGREGFATLCTMLAAELDTFLHNNPLKEGISKEELKSRMPSRSDTRFFSHCILALEKQGVLTAERDLVKPANRKGNTATGHDDVLLRLAGELARSGFEPPSPKELSVALLLPEKSVLERLNILVRDGRALKIKSDLFYAPESLESIREKVVMQLERTGEITTGDFRELTGLSRKYMIPLLEYFDEQKLTIRVGDRRILRKKSG